MFAEDAAFAANPHGALAEILAREPADQPCRFAARASHPG
jgi:hypothetical protein